MGTEEEGQDEEGEEEEVEEGAIGMTEGLVERDIEEEELENSPFTGLQPFSLS